MQACQPFGLSAQRTVAHDDKFGYGGTVNILIANSFKRLWRFVGTGIKDGIGATPVVLSDKGKLAPFDGGVHFLNAVHISHIPHPCLASGAADGVFCHRSVAGFHSQFVVVAGKRGRRFGVNFNIIKISGCHTLVARIGHLERKGGTAGRRKFLVNSPIPCALVEFCVACLAVQRDSEAASRRRYRRQGIFHFYVARRNGRQRQCEGLFHIAAVEPFADPELAALVGVGLVHFVACRAAAGACRCACVASRRLLQPAMGALAAGQVHIAERRVGVDVVCPAGVVVAVAPFVRPGGKKKQIVVAVKKAVAVGIHNFDWQFRKVVGTPLAVFAAQRAALLGVNGDAGRRASGNVGHIASANAVDARFADAYFAPRPRRQNRMGFVLGVGRKRARQDGYCKKY